MMVAAVSKLVTSVIQLLFIGIILFKRKFRRTYVLSGPSYQSGIQLYNGNVCEIFLKWDGLWCPCCGYRLRTSPRNSKFKAELRARKEIDKAKISVVYKQPPPYPSSSKTYCTQKVFLDYDSLKMCITCKSTNAKR
jgi:hypothetical protein